MSIQKAFVDKEVRVTIIVLVNFDIEKISSVDGLEVQFIFISTLVYQTDLYRFDLLPILEDNSNSNYVQIHQVYFQSSFPYSNLFL